MKINHVRKLSGNHEVKIRRGETKIESGFLQTKHALFEHATGSGKTGLGLVCAGHMLEDVDFVVIVCPKISIANQWWKQAYDLFGSDTNRNQFWSYTLNRGEAEVMNESHPTYVDHRLEKEELDLLSHTDDGILICVQKTFFHPTTLSRLKAMEEYGNKWGLIVDEAHNLIQAEGTSLDKLESLNPEWRLALTASFENRKNPLGTVDVKNWFTGNNDDNVDTYPLAAAIADGHLKKFDVQIHTIESKFSKEDFKTAKNKIMLSRI